MIVIKPIKFDLPIDGVKVKIIEELREHFTVEILALYEDGRLLQWCRTRKMFEEVSRLEAIPAAMSRAALLQKLCDIFSVNANDMIIAAWAERTGQDQHGRYAELILKGVVQRFRFSPLGSFLMGSPDSESERSKNEIQHCMSLQQGFWMADTACTQALWQAVMGTNPAQFSDNPENPVEKVSWNDVQIFLQRANDLVSGIQVRLPSEAEWEYACRAGTHSAFSFGGDVSPDHANYDGNYEYAGGGSKGEYRQKTVPVKFFPANPWGLYQMHGNVWEWCQDCWENNASTLMDSPKSSNHDCRRRVVRGGSWYTYPFKLRSAFRDYYPSDSCDYSVGFRVVISL
jgi:formylglycine-generating enzyme required for sulfatase activity